MASAWLCAFIPAFHLHSFCAFRALSRLSRSEVRSRIPDNLPMSAKVLFGFHAVGVRLKTAPQSVIEVYYEATRRDARMRQFLERAKEANVRLIEADALRIAKLAGTHGHQGVAARVEPVAQARSLDDLLDAVEGVRPAIPTPCGARSGSTAGSDLRCLRLHSSIARGRARVARVSCPKY